MSNDTYTLAEAERELRLRECRKHGHDWEMGPRSIRDEAPTHIYCARCNWSGAVTMGEKP